MVNLSSMGCQMTIHLPRIARLPVLPVIIQMSQQAMYVGLYLHALKAKRM